MPLRYIKYDFIQNFPTFPPKIYFKHMLLCILTALLKSFWLLPLFLFKHLNYIFSLNKSYREKKLQAPKGNNTFFALASIESKDRDVLHVAILDNTNKENQTPVVQVYNLINILCVM